MQNLSKHAFKICLNCGQRFTRWITAKQPSKHLKAGPIRWAGRIIAALVVVWFFALGPGNLLASVHPGFDNKSNGNITVFFQNGVDAATADRVLVDTEAAYQLDRAFWGDPTGGLKPITVYVCISRARWFQLGLCDDGNALTVGSSILLYPNGIGKIYLRSIIGVEVSHALAAQHTGAISFHALPCWAEEGLATHLGAPAWSSDGRMEADLTKMAAPRLQRLSTLNKRLQWTSAYETYPPVTAMYTHARHFVEYLLSTYGVERFQSYLRQVSFLKNPNEVFESVYGLKLDDADHSWLNDGKSLHRIPQNTALVSGSVSALSFLKWSLPYLLIGLGMLWLLRQIFRIGRMVGWLLLRATRTGVPL